VVKLDLDFHVIPTSQEEHVMNSNAREYDEIFSRFSKRCSAPDCRYPIPHTGNFALPLIGEVCNLCHTMYYLVQTRDFFLKAHQEYQERRKKDGR
jgi:hypothetical protein